MSQSAGLVCLPAPAPGLVEQMVCELVLACRDQVPDAPGALYLRPTLIGTEPNIGAAASPSSQACLYVLASPVGDYFARGQRPLKVALQTRHMRTTPAFGRAKSGANYVQALGHIERARAECGVDQLLFCPDGDVQETGASNFVLLDDRELLTKGLSDAYLHGVTRDSLLTLARDLGYRVVERDIGIDELIERAPHCEAALSGTAAVLAGVGTLVHEGREILVGNGEVGPNTTRLRAALTAIQHGARGSLPQIHRSAAPSLSVDHDAPGGVAICDPPSSTPLPAAGWGAASRSSRRLDR
jgi:branched-chain amino acid aminotransferase